jgi:IclR family transcriptional regulator, KDG regulon repressor
MYNAPILKKAVEVIKLIVKENRPLGVTDIARTLSLSKSTTFGILRSLEEEGFLLKDPLSKKFSTGNTLFELSRKIVRANDVSIAARPYLVRLAESVQETVFLGVREDDVVRVVDVIEANKSFKISSQVGTTFAITAGIVGKVLLASIDKREATEFLLKNGLRRRTENSIVDVDEYFRELEKTRMQGYALDLEEFLKGMRAIGAPIYSGHVAVAVVWIVGFTASIADEKIPKMVNSLKHTAELISTRLSPFLPNKAESTKGGS